MLIAFLINAFIVLIFFGGWRFVNCQINFIHHQNMFKKVGWIAEKESYSICYSDSVRLRDKDLISYIIVEQKSLNISKEFCIDYSNATEVQDAEEICELHKADVIKSYFSDFLVKSKYICNLDSLEYYMFSLFNYLNAPIEKGRWHNFSKTYYKLYLVSRMYCEKNGKINISGGLNSKQIEKIILEYSA